MGLLSFWLRKSSEIGMGLLKGHLLVGLLSQEEDDIFRTRCRLTVQGTDFFTGMNPHLFPPFFSLANPRLTQSPLFTLFCLQPHQNCMPPLVLHLLQPPPTVPYFTMNNLLWSCLLMQLNKDNNRSTSQNPGEKVNAKCKMMCMWGHRPSC